SDVSPAAWEQPESSACRARSPLPARADTMFICIIRRLPNLAARRFSFTRQDKSRFKASQTIPTH
ncbi:hypothetical protein, partial [Neorhizobium petrolearium]|uniref:hypothetical protein n=1 Tax=Neorhizobium petrolearium TaxID=515361 RepID=UPI001D1266BF